MRRNRVNTGGRKGRPGRTPLWKNNEQTGRCSPNRGRCRYRTRPIAAQGFPTMPQTHPLTASGSRDALKRPRPIPREVRSAVLLMIYGDVKDEEGRPLDFISAGARHGIKPDIMRRWLDRSEVRAFLRAERRIYREAACAGNEAAMVRVRSRSKNGMAICAAVRVLEELDSDQAGGGRSGPIQQPGFVFVLQQAPPRTRRGRARAAYHRCTCQPRGRLSAVRKRRAWLFDLSAGARRYPLIVNPRVRRRSGSAPLIRGYRSICIKPLDLNGIQRRRITG